MDEAQALGEVVDRFVGVGWNERVSFMVAVDVNGERVYERRTESRRQDPYLTQLAQSVYHVPVRGGSGGGSVNKPESKIPGNLVRPDELMYEVQEIAVKYLGYACRPAAHALRALVEHPHDAAEAKDIIRELRYVERKIRLFLGYDAEKRLLADTLCDKCGGALIVAEDASSDVKCVGTPSERACGHSYPRWQWISLYEAQQRESR